MSKTSKPPCGGVRANICMRFVAILDEMEALEADCEAAGKRGDLGAEEARDAAVSLSWCWSTVASHRPRMKRGAK